MNIKIAFIIFLFCTVLSGIFILKTNTIGGNYQNHTTNITPTPTPYYTNYALLGYGGGGHEGGALTDTMIVAHVDDNQKKVFLVSVPRDTYVSLQIQKSKTDGFKINEAYASGLDDSSFPDKLPQYKSATKGGINAAKLALYGLIGQEIKHVFVVNFELFVSFIDTIGGVAITRNTSFKDEWYPIEAKTKDSCGKTDDEIKELAATLSARLLEREFDCRYETLELPAGQSLLDGDTALKYARSRHSDVEGGDFYRSQHQKQIILAVKEKLSGISGLPYALSLAKTFIEYVDTDLEIAQSLRLVREIYDKRNYQIVSLGLTTDNVMREGVGPYNAYVLLPAKNDFKSIHNFLKEAYVAPNLASVEAKYKKIR